MPRLTWDEISNTLQQRRSYDSPLMGRMLDTRDRYNADVVIPLTDVEGEPLIPPLGPQVIHDGIEHTAMRAASSFPVIGSPALDPTKHKGRRSEEYAVIRRRALQSAHHHSLSRVLLSRSFRMMSGYGTSALVVVPCFKTGRARMELRSSLNAYPDPRSYDDYLPPKNVGFVYGRSYYSVREQFGAVVDDLVNHSSDRDGLWDVCEWIDEYDIVMGVLGPRSPYGLDPMSGGGGIEVRRWPNRADGMVPAAVGKRVTLDRVAGQMEIITGSADWMDRLMALEVAAAEKGVFPSLYALADEGRVPELTSGEWKDGRSGDINLLAHTKAVGQLIQGSAPHAQQVIGILERNSRGSGGAIQQFGGEPGGMRTGRGLDSMAALSVDPRVAEMQHVMEAMLSRSINPAIMAIEKGYWPKKKYVCFSGAPGDKSLVEYVPEEHFETYENSVTYSFPGMDLSSISIALLQLVGGDLIPKSQARTKHPLIDNPEEAEREIIVERLRESALISVQQQSTAGALAVLDIAHIIKQVTEGNLIEDAIIAQQQEAQKRQAALPPPTPEGMGAPPETMPGLSPMGAGAESQFAPEGPPQIQGPMPSQENLRHFVRTLNTPSGPR